MELADAQRLSAVERSGLLDGTAETTETANRYARMVRRQLGVGAAMISVVLDDQQVFVGAAGLDGPLSGVRATTIEASFCQHVVTGERPLVVVEAGAEELVRDNDAVAGLGVTAYCGVPLLDADGVVLGAVCAVDSSPRAWDEDDVEALRDVAAALRDHLVARRALDDARSAREGVAGTRALRLLDGRLDTPPAPVDDPDPADWMLARFADVVAHDLRSPLGTTMGLLETLGRDDLDLDRSRLVLTSAQRTLGRAVRLLDRLHEHALARTGTLATDPVDLSVVLRATLDDLAEELAEAGATVTCHSLLPVVPGDATLLGQVFANLLRNAARHAAAGRDGCQVWIDVVHRGTTAHLVVADDGPGIPTEVLPELFQPGARGDDGGPGLGIGLATARTVVERHGGRMWPGTSSTGGAAFHLELPLLVPVDRRVLVVAGRPELQSLFRLALRGRSGTELRVVAGVAAGRAAVDDRPLRTGDLAIVDLRDGEALSFVAELVAHGVQVHVVADPATDPAAVLDAIDLGASVTGTDELPSGPSSTATVLAGPDSSRTVPVAGPLPSA